MWAGSSDGWFAVSILVGLPRFALDGYVLTGGVNASATSASA